MKIFERFNDPDLGKRMVSRVRSLALKAADRLGRPIMLMEVCGTHTAAISKSGIRMLLADLLELRSGPGCPVCVTAPGDIEAAVNLSRLPGVTVATFGDMIRVPGISSSLEQERARGSEVNIFYSPGDAVDYARLHPEKEVVFIGVGFETTAPLVALSVDEARESGIKNYSVLSLHKIVPPVLSNLLSTGELSVDGLILPGHVCVITGRRALDFVAGKYNVPAAIAGFEAMDILAAVHSLLEAILEGRAAVVNCYPRVVKENGNIQAQKIIEKIFTPVDAHWRGFGEIAGSGLAFREEYSDYDASYRYAIGTSLSTPKTACRCGELLKGKIYPGDCGLFARSCTPATPVGPCMVSSEGTCSVYYRYHRTAIIP
ncbi:MAG: hydrogenase assembly protein HupF [Peptococcaceae bacterium BICA1-7]|nr:MAG: hydrogenase assembly protein HupF [Peptococcaceae bacterium BICA1-7]HBV96400.1 hydrogenase formation protein HypD [Desulfotomaculum sp.]